MSTLEIGRSQIERELQSFKDSASHSTSKVEELEAKVESLRAQNRETLSLHEAKTAAHDRLGEELSAQHQKFVSFRKQLSELEEKNQSLEAAASSAKYREQSLQREVESLKKNNDWNESELKRVRDESTKLRKEKNATISDLQRTSSEAQQIIEQLRRTETAQRQRLEELQQKVEQSLVRIQELQDEAAQNHESFRAELDTSRRYAELQKQSATSAKTRLEEVNAELDQLKGQAAAEIGDLQTDLENTHKEKENVEGRMAELESQIEGLEATISELRNLAQTPGTPRRALGAAFDTPGRAGSPGILSPGLSASRGGISTTRIYAENSQLKTEVRTLREKNEKNAETMQEMMELIERAKPEIDELNQEKERLELENRDMTALLDEAVAEKDAARKEARKAKGDHQGLLRECENQRQQLRDLGAQISILVLQQQIKEKGLGSLTAEERLHLEQVAKNEVPDEELNGSTDTGRLISQRLVIFSNITELQKQNQDLLRTIREVADQYEGSEAQARTNQIEKDRQELAQLRDRIAQHEDQINSLNLQLQSTKKQRDMFQRMIASRGQHPTGSDAGGTFGHSLNGQVPSTPPPGDISAIVAQTPRSEELATYHKQIKDLITSLDALRQETATDQALLKQQADNLGKENNRLHTEKLRLNNAIELAAERYKLLEANVKLLKSENDQARQRCDGLETQAAKRDMQNQQVTEDLLEAKSMAQSLERENNNLKAARDSAKEKEARLEDEKRTLLEERDRLNKMVADLQNLRNEHELAESENRRRLQTRIELLESEVQSAKRRLEDDFEDHRKAGLRHESDLIELRRRNEDLMKILNDIRPELASVKTERDQLQARVDELKTELRIAEERRQTLQPRPTPRANGSAETNDDGLTREDELGIEIDDLKHQLDNARQDLESAKTDADNYRVMAEDFENQYKELHDAQEQYQEHMENELSDRVNEIQELRQRVEEISTELGTTNTELSELRRAHDEEILRYTQQKGQHEAEYSRLQDEVDRYKETADIHQQDVKSQAEIATRAQESYEQEHQKHSDALRNLQAERELHNQLKSEVLQLRVAEETARTSLHQSEEHWSDAKARYEHELAEARTRFNDLKAQNKILHEQLENVGAQISSLKDKRMSVAAGDGDAASSDPAIGSLQELIKYLRSEKDIVDVQYELSLQENRRLKQQLDHVQNQLDQTREKLSAEQLSQAQSMQTSRNVKEFEHTIEQLNLYRESNTSLRHENGQLKSQRDESRKEVEELRGQLAPLQTKLQEIEGQMDLKTGELEKLREDRDHWQKRHSDVLQKYDRIDPAELEALKTQIETLRTERDQAQEQINGFEETIESTKRAAMDETKSAYEERRLKMIEQFKDRSRELSGKIKEKDTTIQSLTTERDELQQQLQSILEQSQAAQEQLQSTQQQLQAVQQELETTKTARDDALMRVNTNSGTDIAMVEEGQVEESDTGLSDDERQALEGRIQVAENRASEEAKRAASLQIEAQNWENRTREFESQAVSITGSSTKTQTKLKHIQSELQQRIASLNNELSQVKRGQPDTEPSQTHSQDNDLQHRISELIDELSKAQNRATQAEERVRALEVQLSSITPTVNVVSSEEFEKLKEELAVAQKEAEDLRTRADMADSSLSVTAEDGTSIPEQVAQQVAAIRAELEAKHQEQANAAERAAEQKHQDRTDKMKKKLNEALKKRNEENEETIQTLKNEHEMKIGQLNSEHQADLARIRQEAQTNAAPDASSTSTNKTAEDTGAPEATVKTEINPSEWSEQQVRELITGNAVVKKMLSLNVTKKVDEARAKFQAEQDMVIAEKVKQDVEGAKAKVKEEVEKMWKAKFSLKENGLKNAQAKIEVVQKTAQETPEKPVGEVWEIAKVAKPVPAVQPPKPSPASQPASLASLTGQSNPLPSPVPAANTFQAIGLPASQQNNASSLPQSNGANVGTFGPSPFGQPSFSQSGPAMGAGAFGRPSHVSQNQGSQPFFASAQPMGQNHLPSPNQGGQPFGGFNGPAQPGFKNGQSQSLQQHTTTTSRPNSPFTAPQQQPGQQPTQGGRDRGQENVGTGPAVLRDLVGQNQGQPIPSQQLHQSGIPRGGGIPRPGGRGQFNQQSQGNAQGAGQSNIGRGGGRGARGGRGGGNIQTNVPGGQGQGQSSPRQLNPSAMGFQPGGGAGRGQKRSREEGGDADGGYQGGKRPRGGGRGGPAGGEHAA
jgi:nucleoprotein TPR